eukprot:TRINITY_DN1855_c0_g2_i1.p1 TRINITY_DN1855_c0_g2~~TRINITY_DN1855_c0_g2_i1.p1  ORF type:complete len:1412 (+),score=353.86 TRINITY_DN1855_c0_g2_i1:84-4319(+)
MKSLFVAVGVVLSATGVSAQCKSSQSWCQSFQKTTAPASASSSKCGSRGSSSCQSGLLDWQIQAVVAQHNLYREKHGACPVTYSKEIETWTLGSAGFGTTCSTGNLKHNSGAPYGENIAMVGRGGINAGTWDAAEGVKNWYCGEEGCYDYNNGGFSGSTGHMTQVVWKDSLEIGCGLCHIPDSSYTKVYIMCNYKKAGNYGGQFGSNVLSPNTAPSGCATSPTTPAGPTPPAPAPPTPASSGDEFSKPSGGPCPGSATKKGACGSTECWCDGYKSVAPPASASSSKCAKKSTCQMGLLDWQIERVLAQHNYYREQHGACPMTYNKEIETWTLGSAGFGTTCSTGNLKHNSGGPYGENIAMVGKSGIDSGTWDPAEGVKNWYCGEEGCYDYNNGGFSGSTGHMTQVVWKDSLEIGCGLCHRDQGYIAVYLMCNYKKAGNYGGQFGSNVLKKGTAPSGCAGAPPTTDECAADPCDNGQSCSDPDKTKSKDFTCTCTKDTSISATGQPATCETDECASSPCRSNDQTCVDKNTGAKSLHDFECTCKSDTSITKVDGPATCTKDECASNPCGSQTCVDPNPSPSVTNDYTCTCQNGAMATGGKATCDTNECDSSPCGSDQTCTDRNTASNSRYDFECACKNDASITKKGGKATCTNDECTPDRCGAGQTCADPNPSPTMTGDYTCTCQNGVMTTGGKATCDTNECDSSPCGSDQTCTDTNTASNSKNDFECACKDDPATKARGGSVPQCVVDECTATPSPCGTQTCEDTKKGVSQKNDYTCKCAAPSTATAIGKPAVCAAGSNDECTMGAPCGADQTCVDPDQTASSTNDFLCTCSKGVGSATGKAASCVLDECDAQPCSGTQACMDPDTSLTATGDFTCACKAPLTGSATGKPATCVDDECAVLPGPCGADQKCKDPDTSSSTHNDFTCTCPNGVTATGVAATCEIDECNANPCGTEQLCEDSNRSKASQSDYVCKCKNDPSITHVGGVAICTVNDCDSTPCGKDQKCTDPKPTPDSHYDFVCTCPNGATATGTSATCDLDECAANPCGLDQLCEDKNTSTTSQHDFVCTCKDDKQLQKIDGRATCEKNECDDQPCGTGQLCREGSRGLGPNSLKDYTCSCSNDPDRKEVGHPVAVCGADECLLNEPCGKGQVCTDPDTTVTGDFVCQCRGGKEKLVGKPLAECNECTMSAADPCRGPLDEEESCEDPNTSPESLGDFICTCPNHGTQNTGGPAQCSKQGECKSDPCGDSHAMCSDPNPNVPNDFTCKCLAGSEGVSVGKEVTCTIDECAVSPCGDQTCRDPNTKWDSRGDFICNCTAPLYGDAVAHRALCSAVAPASGLGTTQRDDDDDSFPWWTPVLIGVGLISACGVAAYMLSGRKKMTNPKVSDFIELEYNENKENATPLAPPEQESMSL